MSKEFLFYDIETTGLNKAFDQIVQFAAIRTDTNLNEISRHEFFITLNPDIVPAPHALITHRIPISEIQKGKNEYETILEIYNLLNTPNTISLGYNTLGFDDEFLRFSFFRNLLPPYNHQFANGCSRADIYPMTVMYYLFSNDSLKWPIKNGKVSLKLENLNTENNITQGTAHNAMVDVEVTLALAKKMKTSNQKMWDYVLGYFNKETDIQRVSKLDIAFTINNHSFREGIVIDGSFGADSKFQSVALSLGSHNHYKNQSLWLRLDANDLHQTNKDNIAESTWVIRKKPGEPGIILPTLDRFLGHIEPKRQELIQSNLKWMNHNQTILQDIIDYHRDFTYPRIENIDPDAALYQMGFLSPQESQLSEKFHKAKVEEKVNLLDEFQNPILRELAIRIIAQTNVELLSSTDKSLYDEYLQACHHPNNQLVIDYKGNRKFSSENAFADISAIENSNEPDEEQRKILNELKAYIKSLEAIYA